MSGGMQRTKTVTMDPMKVAKAAVVTGAGGAVFQYLAKPLFPENEFLLPFMHMTVAAGLTFWMLPDGSATLRSAAIGALMGAQCMFLAQECDLAGALRYGALTATSAYIGTEFIMPKLMSLETEVQSKYL